MEKINEFFRLVFFNLEKSKVDLQENRIIPYNKMVSGVRAYFGYVTDKSVKQAITHMVNDGYVDAVCSGFKLTDKAIEEFSGAK